ncbi:hypothetical protein D9M69_447700 [compost metagenome]
MSQRAHDQRWANPVEFEHYAKGLPGKALCRLLRRCERTVRDWRSGRRPIPAWAVEALRLHWLESRTMLWEMTGRLPEGANAEAQCMGVAAGS